MCVGTSSAPTGVDEYFVFSPLLQSFIASVNEIRSKTEEPEEIIAKIRPMFGRLLADKHWLPVGFQEPKEGSGMGGGIGMWLLYRAGDGSLALSSLVVPPGAMTPVHDHLAWGLVGLYRGTQDEVVYQRTDNGTDESHAKLEELQRNSLQPGDMYDLLPAIDIHQVRTTSTVTSVSLHLLSNDNGCIWRHKFLPEEELVEPFKSGWLNVPCHKEAGS